MSTVGEISTPYPTPTDKPDGPGAFQAIGVALQKLDSVANIAALPATLNWTGRALRVRSCPGAYFWWDGAAWQMYGVAVFANATARDAAIVAPAQGMQARLTDQNILTEYSAIYNSSTNINGREVAGWYELDTNIRRHYHFTTTISAGANNAVILTQVIRRRSYAQRVFIRTGGLIAAGGSITGGIAITASTGGTVSSGHSNMNLTVSGQVLPMQQSFVDIAAGAGTDVTITLAVSASSTTVTITPLVTDMEVLVAGEYS